MRSSIFAILLSCWTSFGFVPHRPLVSTTKLLSPLFLAAETETSINGITKDAEDRMSKTIDSVKMNLSTVRTGRASSSILDRVKVDYYGVETPCK
jgi:hypothetical protein